jgi:hypothetical protein
MKNSGNKITMFAIAVLFPIASIHAVNPAIAGDACYIHSGCTKGVGYSQKGSLGQGWYCTDGQEVTTNKAILTIATSIQVALPILIVSNTGLYGEETSMLFLA